MLHNFFALSKRVRGNLKLKLFQRSQATDGQAVRNLTDNGRCWVGVVSHRVDSLGCHGENDGVGGLGQQVAVVHCTAQWPRHEGHCGLGLRCKLRLQQVRTFWSEVNWRSSWSRIIILWFWGKWKLIYQQIGHGPEMEALDSYLKSNIWRMVTRWPLRTDLSPGKMELRWSGCRWQWFTWIGDLTQ